MKEVIKEFESKLTGDIISFKLTKKEMIIKDNVNYIHSYWIAIEPYNDNDITNYYEILEFNCIVPTGYNDLDLDTLKTECLTGDTLPNEEALKK